ncbi:MAG TPA: DUF2460 domain-containing protein [Pyrinomonadaceae bacterium]|nr:DUF2460 domain-containing protein [Pyrinomonadaceae bacterium]
MPRTFHEVLFDPELVAGETGSGAAITAEIELANAEQFNPATGIFKTNVARLDAIRKITVPIALSNETARSYFNEFWLGGFGSYAGFRVRIPFDFTAVAEPFGVGNGSTTDFYLTKTYNRPGITSLVDVRRIVKPVRGGSLYGGGVNLFEANGTTPRVIPSTAAQALGVPALTVYANGVAASGWVIDNSVGLIHFNTPPANGVVLTWSGEFDTPVCFTGNSFQMRWDITAELQSITLREILPAELGITV